MIVKWSRLFPLAAAAVSVFNCRKKETFRTVPRRRLSLRAPLSIVFAAVDAVVAVVAVFFVSFVGQSTLPIAGLCAHSASRF